MALSLGSILGDTNSRIRPAIGALLLPSVVVALLTSGPSSADTENPPFVVAALLMPVIFAVIFGLYVWLLRRAAPFVGAPRPHVGVMAILWTGLIGGAIVGIGLLALVVPGLVAIVLMALVAPIVAYEGATGWAAITASASTVRRHLGTFTALTLGLLALEILLSPSTFGVLHPVAAVFAWELALGTVLAMYSTLTFAAAWTGSRGARDEGVSDAGSGDSDAGDARVLADSRHSTEVMHRGAAAVHGAAPAWYPDPHVPHQLRWWDGTAWTVHVMAEPPALI